MQATMLPTKKVSQTSESGPSRSRLLARLLEEAEQPEKEAVGQNITQRTRQAAEDEPQRLFVHD